MKVRVIRSSRDDCPDDLRMFLPCNNPVTLAQEYEVHAIVTFNGIGFVQIVDDLRYPSWQPAWLFQMIDGVLPDDWLCNIFNDGSLIVGPSFIACDEESYRAMAELDADQVDRFWKRLESRRNPEMFREDHT